jgi:hypothetical protein
MKGIPGRTRSKRLKVADGIQIVVQTAAAPGQPKTFEKIFNFRDVGATINGCMNRNEKKIL